MTHEMNHMTHGITRDRASLAGVGSAPTRVPGDCRDPGHTPGAHGTFRTRPLAP